MVVNIFCQMKNSDKSKTTFTKFQLNCKIVVENDGNVSKFKYISVRLFDGKVCKTKQIGIHFHRIFLYELHFLISSDIFMQWMDI